MSTFTTSRDNIETLAIGGFDGIHLAHQKLIQKVGKNGGLMIISKFTSNLTPKKYRCKFVNKPCFFYDLNSILKLDCQGFADFLKGEFSNLKNIVVGYDFRYGHKRSCTIEDLKKSFNVYIINEVKIDGISVHSGIIREYIRSGDIKRANKLLGRNYSIEGRTIKGQGIGSKELVPTLNLTICDFLLPKNGVYITRTKIGEEIFNSVTFIGIRKSTDGCFSVESHILDKTITGQNDKAEIFFYEKIRDNKKFNLLEDLKKRINKDIETARSYFDKR